MVSSQELGDAVHCIFSRLKHRIIRLRRRSHDDWPYFVGEIEQHLEDLCSCLNTRWLVSICDTYADFGSPVEKGNAMCISLIANWEKLALTHRRAFGLENGVFPDRARLAEMKSPLPLWDGMTSMVLDAGANALPNMFSRLSRLTESTPVLQKILLTILERMRQNNRSTLSEIDAVHEKDLFSDIFSAFSASGQTDEGACRNDEGRTKSVTPPETETRGISSIEKKIDSVKDELSTLISTCFENSSFSAEIQYHDLVELLGRLTPLAPPIGVRLVTDNPVAITSNDHLFPHGTARDNTRAPNFVQKCEQILGSPLNVLDLGCSGGGLVFDFSLRGHCAIGLEGSDYSAKRLRAEWRQLRNNLFTCDISKPFDLVEKERSERILFDLIMCWEVLEHLSASDLPQLFSNVRKHLKPRGLFTGSISTRPSGNCPNGGAYHLTVQDRRWWEQEFIRNGFVQLDSSFFDYCDYPRGNGASPLYQADYRETPDQGFHFVAISRHYEDLE